MRLPIADIASFGVIKDIPPHRLPPGAWSDAEAVRFDSRGATALGSQRTILVPTGGANSPSWIGVLPPRNEPVFVWASGGALWTYDLIGGVQAAVTGGGSVTLAGERLQGFVFQGIAIFNSEYSVPQFTANLVPPLTVAPLTNWATNPGGVNTRARIMRPYKQFLVALNITDGTGTYPYRVRWSDAAEPGTLPSSWAAQPDNFAGERDLADTPGYIVDGLMLGDNFIIYGENTVWGMQFIQGGDTMRTWQIFSEMGIIAPDCVAAFPGGHCVATENDLVIHTGVAGSARSVLRDKLRRWLAVNIHGSTTNRCFVIANNPAKEMWYFFPTEGSTYANKVILWNWETDQVGIRSIPETPFAVASAARPLGASDTWAVGF